MAGKYSTIEVTIPIVSGHAAVEHLAVPPRFERPRRVHPRRVLPLVRPGKQRGFHSMTPELALFRSAPAPVGGNLAIDTNTALTAPGAQDTASSVDEPSVAMNGQTVFYTGNWYAAVSSDAGKTFSFINPASAFQPFDPPGSSFCCDQVVHYIPSIDTFVWLLQYGPSPETTSSGWRWQKAGTWPRSGGSCSTSRPPRSGRRARSWIFPTSRWGPTACT